MPSFPGMARSRTGVTVQSHNVKVADNTSSPCKLPQPPSSSTPTRALLRRIQRRSSTSTETVIGHASSMQRPSTMTMSAAALKRTPQISTNPTARKSSSISRPSSLQRRGSSASVASVSTTSRHTRNESNATLKSMTTITMPTSSVKVTAPAQKVFAVKSAAPLERKGEVAFKARISVPPPTSTVFEQVKKDNLVLASLTMPSLVPVKPTADVPRKTLSPPPKKRYSMIERTTLLRDAGSHQGQGLTQEAAAALEQEFAEQERILQGLQRDNERKTIEVEELRRQKAKFEDFCARHFGVDDWHEMVFGVKQPRSPSSIECNRDAQAKSEKGKDNEDLSSISSSSQAIVESLLKTLQTPLRNQTDVPVAQEPSQTFLDDTLASSPLKLSNDSSKVMSDSFESAVADTAPNTPNRDEEMLKVPRHLVQSLFDNQQSLLRALSQHV